MAFGEKSNSRVNKDKGPALGDKLKSNGKTGKRLTILSIDGGGVRGIIPARILEVLEGYLQALDGKDRHLWEYFDLIAGTSSGGLITALITTPTHKGSCWSATEVVQFFEQDALKIFPNRFTNNGCLRWLSEGFESVFGPIYHARPLKGLLDQKFGKAPLSQALTNVIIPAFDTQGQVPVFFSNLEGVDEANPLYNVRVKDACLATTAVPIFLPAARFQVQVSGYRNQPAGPKVFNVIDGGIAVNDPTLVAVTQAIAQERQANVQEITEEPQANVQEIMEEPQANVQEIMEEPQANVQEITKEPQANVQEITEEPQATNGQKQALTSDNEQSRKSDHEIDFSNVLVLSLGSGQHRMRFLANRSWSSVQWLLSRSGSPLLSSFLSASEDMVEYYTSMILDAHKSGGHYLRIQTELSQCQFLKIDDAGQQNLKLLEAEAELVRFHVSRRNLDPRKSDTVEAYGSALYR